jgi:hypothetical protein
VNERRQVRVAQSFFDRLDEILPDERTADGNPSATDFLLHELPAIIDALADDYENVTLDVDGVPGVRVFITAGHLVSRVAIYIVVAADGAVDIIYLDVA